MEIKVKLCNESLIELAQMVAEINSNAKNNKERRVISQEKTYTVLDVASLTKRTKITIRNHINAGLLTANKIGKSFLITQESLDEYIGKNNV
jgi:excisionase family DNA binding protein